MWKFYPLLLLLAVTSYAAWRWGIVGAATVVPCEVAILATILRLRGFTWRAALVLVLAPWRSERVCLRWIWQPGVER